MANGTPDEPVADSPADGALPSPAVESAPPSGGDPLHKLLWSAWRAAAGPETPTLNQLVAAGVKRVDVDAISGYVAVVMAEETHRAIGVRRELVGPLVAAFTGREASEVEALLAKGPARVEPARAERSSG